jgi:peptide/nickel transport system substrate-binding protein
MGANRHRSRWGRLRDRTGRHGAATRLVVGAATVGALLATACGSDSDDRAVGSVAGATSTAPSTEETASSGAGGGQRLVYAGATPIRTLDFLGVFDVTAWALLVGNVNEPLTRLTYAADGELEWVPGLAESWERIAPLQWRFKIREGVMFSDGKPLTAADAVFSINKEVRPDAEGSVVVANLDRAEVVSDYLLDVFTKTPDNFAPRSLYRIGVQQDGWGVSNAEAAATTAVGTGPYVLAEFSPERAILRKAEDYWGDNSEIIEEIEVRVVVEPGTRLAAVQAGEVNVAEGLSPALLAAAPATISVPGVEVELMRIDTQRPPFDDVNVRRAMNMAIDRKLLIESLFEGFATLPNGQGVPPQAFGYNDDLVDYPFDPEAARSAIEAAGATGAAVDIMCTLENGATAGDVCNTVAQMLNDVGLSASVDFVTFDEWIEDGLNAPQNGLTPPALFHIATSTDTLNAGAPTAQWFLCDSARNTFCDDDVVHSIETASAETDVDSQETAWAHALELIREAAPIVWLAVPSMAVATTEGVTGQLYPLSGDVYWSEWRIG